MMQLEGGELRNARRIVAKLALDLNVVVAREFFPNRPVEEVTGLLLIERALIAADRRPLSLTDIARRTNMARSTVARRLGNLIEMGLARREGRRYCADQAGLDRAYRAPRIRKTLGRLKVTVAELEAELSKMDEKI